MTRLAGHEHPMSGAFLATIYTVDHPELEIKIGQLHVDLDHLLRHRSCRSWAYLTAWNPGSIQLSEAENIHRQILMRQDLQEWETFPGRGIPDSNDWTPEESLLILGIPFEEALRVSRKWEQLAFLFGEIGCKARLIWCTDT
ncbi:MAG: DUF3293 domain-containing protein [Saprospiraceae bacterium]|nr:DUF3293 domain-containing protein [Saprospiraceae bacterium]